MPKYTATFAEITQETPDVKTFKLKLSDETKFDFLPGQFVIASTGDRDDNGIIYKRSYSIASPPHEKGCIELCVKIKPAPSFSSLLAQKKVGDTLYLEGPFGKFIFHLPLTPNTIFIAGGAGIAPIRSMIKTILQQPLQHPTTLLYSFHTSDDYIYHTELEALAQQHPQFTILATVSGKEINNPHWNGIRGRVTEHLPIHIKQTQDYTIYLCGPPDLVTDTTKHLLQLGVKERNIYKEQW